MQRTAQSRHQLLVARALMGRRCPERVALATSSKHRHRLQRRVLPGALVDGKRSTQQRPLQHRRRRVTVGNDSSLADAARRQHRRAAVGGIPATSSLAEAARRVTIEGSPPAASSLSGAARRQLERRADQWAACRDFLAGARTTLTDELARSRRQLRAFSLLHCGGRA